MKSSVETLEDNKVKVSVTIDESEFDTALNAAYKRIAKEVRLPGFRPGKAPRKVLEARLGTAVGREEAMRDSLPEHYSKAVIEHDVDVIAAPEFEVTGGEEDGPVSFDAVVEVRPVVTISGYDSLTVEVPSPTAPEEEVVEQLDRLRGNFGDLVDADRPAAEGDRVTLDIAGTHDDEPIPGLTSTDYDYQVGINTQIPEIDENLTGASVGDVLEFEAAHPDPEEDEPIQFRIEVKAVQEVELPEMTDEWAAEASEFETVAELRDDITARINGARKQQAWNASREETAKAIGELVDEDAVPEALVQSELNNQIQTFERQIQSQGIGLEQWMQITGTTAADLTEQFREQAEISARVDLGLRAIATAEDLLPTDDDINAEFAEFAEQVGQDVAQIRETFESTGQLSAVRADLGTRKALDWVLERVNLVDPDGNAVDAADLEPDPEPVDDEDEAVDETEAVEAEEGSSE